MSLGGKAAKCRTKAGTGLGLSLRGERLAQYGRQSGLEFRQGAGSTYLVRQGRMKRRSPVHVARRGPVAGRTAGVARTARAPRAATRALPPCVRAVVLLRTEAQLSYGENRRALGMPVSTAKTAFFRAKRRLCATYQQGAT